MFWDFIKSVFSRNDYRAEVVVIVPHPTSHNPVVTIAAGNKRMSLTTSQARELWGKLGQNLERLTPDPKEYRQ